MTDDPTGKTPSIFFFGGPFHREYVTLEGLRKRMGIDVDEDEMPYTLKIWDTEEDVPNFSKLGISPPLNRTVAIPVYHLQSKWGHHYLYVCCYDCSRVYREEDEDEV